MKHIAPPKDVIPARVPSLPVRRVATLILAATAVLVLTDGGRQAKCEESVPAPNIVLILADDMGYGDVQALNPRSKIPTPNLNRLAQQGMTFTDAHTPSAVCTPTRYGLVTGRYCWRTRLKSGVLDGYGAPLIERDRPTVASFLKSHGYTCGVVGKWHLGLNFARSADGKNLDLTKPVSGGPNKLGFDFSYIIPASLDFPPYVYIENGQVTSPETVEQPAQKFPAFLRKGPRAKDLVMEDVLDHLAERATGFVRQQAKTQRPFFLYFPLTAPHKPVLPHPRFRGKTELGPYGDFIVQVDWTVGQVLRAIDEAGVADDTLVIYTSDNGSFMYRRDDPDFVDHVADATVQAYRSGHHTSNYVFRGTKADIWEGGHRVPFFVRWPGRVKPGTRCETTICLVDLFATAADIQGTSPPKGAAEDSHSFLPLLEGRLADFNRPPVIHHSASGMFAIRDGRWKLVLGNGSGGREPPRGKPFQKPYQLFDLAADISERQDLIEKHADVAARLEDVCRRIRSKGTAASAGEDEKTFDELAAKLRSLGLMITADAKKIDAVTSEAAYFMFADHRSHRPKQQPLKMPDDGTWLDEKPVFANEADQERIHPLFAQLVKKAGYDTVWIYQADLFYGVNWHASFKLHKLGYADKDEREKRSPEILLGDGDYVLKLP